MTGTHPNLLKQTGHSERELGVMNATSRIRSEREERAAAPVSIRRLTDGHAGLSLSLSKGSAREKREAVHKKEKGAACVLASSSLARFFRSFFPIALLLLFWPRRAAATAAPVLGITRRSADSIMPLT